MTDLSALRSALPPVAVERLANGLSVCLVPSRRAPLVASAVVYRAGGRDEATGLGGTAHFLEHMMFKGSARFAPGEIDRLTRALGGANNAFTGHDSTLYYFTFAADRWARALDIEADRMGGLALDEREIEGERQVIFEEIAMYEDDPWDALDQEVAATLYDGHPYGRPVLGTRADLAEIDATALEEFHHRRYRPANAVLALAGDLGDRAFDRAKAAFGELDGEAEERQAVDRVRPSGELRQVVRRHGEVPRWLLALPAPAATDPDHAAVRLLLAVLAHGRSSRLHRALVDEGQACAWVTGDLSAGIDPGSLTLAGEVVPGVVPERVEDVLWAELERLCSVGVDTGELERARRMLVADWLFDHEPVQDQAFLFGSALALFDAEHPWRQLERLIGVEADHLATVADRYLRPASGGVLGWSLPPDERD